MARSMPRDAPVTRTALPLIGRSGELAWIGVVGSYGSVQHAGQWAGIGGQSAGMSGFGRYFGITVLVTSLPFTLTLIVRGLGLCACQVLTAAYAAWQLLYPLLILATKRLASWRLPAGSCLIA